MPSFYEFFAGGGMVRAGLGQEWHCLFANDFDHKKSRSYCENWGGAELRTSDIRSLTVTDLPSIADLAWASFPCQDLSLAGAGAGLKGDRSGTFWPFWNLMTGLIQEGRAPSLIVLENVCGTLSSHGGKDFESICAGFHKAGYSVGAVVIDACLFVPQSRPRLFIIGVQNEVKLPEGVTGKGPSAIWHTSALKAAHRKLPQEIREAWIWWRLPLPPKRKTGFSNIIEKSPANTLWLTDEDTHRLLSMMSTINHAKLVKAQKAGREIIGSVYKRTRANEEGQKVQRAEIRFDDIAGCLRTPAGGSSRQLVVVVHGQSVTARLISSRETARLMGLPDTYILPDRYNEAYHLTGDGVVVPVVRHLSKHIFKPILDANHGRKTIAA